VLFVHYFQIIKMETILAKLNAQETQLGMHHRHIQSGSTSAGSHAISVGIGLCAAALDASCSFVQSNLTNKVWPKVVAEPKDLARTNSFVTVVELAAAAAAPLVVVAITPTSDSIANLDFAGKTVAQTAVEKLVFPLCTFQIIGAIIRYFLSLPIIDAAAAVTKHRAEEVLASETLDGCRCHIVDPLSHLCC